MTFAGLEDHLKSDAIKRKQKRIQTESRQQATRPLQVNISIKVGDGMTTHNPSTKAELAAVRNALLKLGWYNLPDEVVALGDSWLSEEKEDWERQKQLNDAREAQTRAEQNKPVNRIVQAWKYTNTNAIDAMKLPDLEEGLAEIKRTRKGILLPESGIDSLLAYVSAVITQKKATTQQTSKGILDKLQHIYTSRKHGQGRVT